MPAHLSGTDVINHLQQVLASGLLLLFGVLSLRVWRRSGPARRDRAALAWSVTAAYFLVGGGYSTGHALLSATGWGMGRNSALLRWVGTWAMTANVARGALSVLFALMLLALLVLRRRWVYPMARSATLVMAAAAVVSTVVTDWIGVRTAYGMLTCMAVLSMLAAVVIMGALLAAVLNDSVDQLLWIALALYALKETVSVSNYAALAWWMLAPHSEVYYFLYGGAVALTTGMCFLAARRLRAAGEGRRVPALFERVYTLRRSPLS